MVKESSAHDKDAVYSSFSSFILHPSSLILGIDIGGSRIKAGMVSEGGRVQSLRSTRTPATLEPFREELQALVAELIREAEAPQAVGIGCKGIVQPQTTLVETLPGTFRFLEGVALSSLIEPALPQPVPIHADNDARVALAGEAVWGAARGRSTVMMLTLGSGVGGAFLAEGKLLRGSRGVAGHVGHLTVEPDGPLCMCGNRGCLEVFFSALAIEGEARAAVHRGCESELTDRFRTRPEKLSCRAVFEAAARDDLLARQIRDRAVVYLAAAIAGLVHAIDPEVVILGGQIAEAGATLFDPVRLEVWRRSRRLAGRQVPILPAQVPDQSGVIGAAALALMNRQE